MRKAIENRISRRSFLKEPLTQEEQQKIDGYVKELNGLSGLTMAFFENGSAAFQSFKATYGMFSNVRSMILLKGKKDMPHLHEKIGYYGEELALFLTDLGLGTCWVGGTFEKEKLPAGNEEELVCVLVLGKVKGASIKEKALRSAARGKIKSLEERISGDQPYPQWVQDGMRAVLLAPSARNSQKAAFTYRDGKLRAEIADDYRFDLVDLGIAKMHFAAEADGVFDWGNGGEFHRA